MVPMFVDPAQQQLAQVTLHKHMMDFVHKLTASCAKTDMIYALKRWGW